jgi:hypothetical protein
MSIPVIIPAEVSGSCDIATGECGPAGPAGPAASDGKTGSGSSPA